VGEQATTKAGTVTSAKGLERWGWLSLLLNVVLVGLHGSLAVSSGSLAVSAEVIHNVLDLLGAAAVLVGIRLAGRKSRRFPYGLYKVESMVALGLACLVLLTAYEIGRDALLSGSREVRAEPWMLALLLFTTILPLLFSHFELRAGRAAHSPALIADALEYRVHTFTTGLVFIGLASQWGNWPLDRVAALLIVLVVLKTGWDLLLDAMRVLLDASLDTDTLLQIRQVIESDPMVTEANWVIGRNAGRYRFVESGLALRASSRRKVESAVLRIETKVRKVIPHIERVLVQVEPARSSHVRYAVPVTAVDGPISEHFGEAPYFTILTLRRDDHSVVERKVAVNPFRDLEKGKGIRVAEWLAAQKVDVVLSREVMQSKGPVYVLRDAGIELRLTEAREPEAAVGMR
jgi:cation diffusion facilitator family transporter